MSLRDELVQTLMEKVDTLSDISVQNDTAVLWQRLIGKFSPLIGPSSVMVLFVRALRTHHAAFPWLPTVDGDDPDAMLFSTFQHALSTQPRAQVLEATRALLGTYIDSLFRLIGTTLTTQFVCSVFRIDGSQSI